mmetsp:Transcript_26693/g.68386  ORF Transcript_26693/g.68386 Transcript_26693/m.68386 type:complete len:397 (-) Transcript_26693:146-1336(-)
MLRRAPPLEISHWHAVGPLGATVLDPVFAELLFVTRWRHISVNLLPSPYPSAPAFGPLPVALSGGPKGPILRDRLLEAVAALDVDGYGMKCSEADEAFCALLRQRVGEALKALLFGDFGIWDECTRPTLARSAPLGFGWHVAWKERRRQLCDGLGSSLLKDRQAAAVLALEGSLSALAERLADADCFGCVRGSGAVDSLTALDACAYGHLAVLYSIPCQPGSQLHQLLSRFSSLVHFCDRVELWLGGVWPDSRSFMAAVASKERMPGAAAASFSQESRFFNDPKSPSTAVAAAPAAAGANSIATSSHMVDARWPVWWELWGWSLGWGRRRKALPKVRKNSPPEWYPLAFGAASAATVFVACIFGCSPLPMQKIVKALEAALQQSDGQGVTGTGSRE